MIGFDFVIEYKKELENIVADALSRREDNSKEEKPLEELIAISQPIPNWVATIKEEVNYNTGLQELVSQIQSDEVIGPWKFVDGMIFFKCRIYLDADSSLIYDIIRQLHSSSHEGYHKTLQRIYANFIGRECEKKLGNL